MCIEELYRCIGQTVIIFITGGGASGCGFTGVLVYVGPQYVTLRREASNNDDCSNRIGSVCDIPVNRIASFCHNAN